MLGLFVPGTGMGGSPVSTGKSASTPGGRVVDFGEARPRTLLQPDPALREVVLPRAFERVAAPFAIARPPALLLPRAFTLTPPAIGTGIAPLLLLPSAREEVPKPFTEGTGRRVYDQEAGMAKLLEQAEELATRQKRPDPRLLMAYLRWKGKSEGEPSMWELAREMAAAGEPGMLRALRRRR